MCYDISFHIAIRKLQAYFPGIVIAPEVNPDFTADHIQAQSFQSHPVITNAGNQMVLNTGEWGVIPDYFRTHDDVRKGRSSMCNAQSEKIVGDERSYWRRIRQNRCLIPVTGIYEHREIKTSRNKIPYHVRIKNRELFCLPGLYTFSHFADKSTGELTPTFTVITRAANPVMAQIHNSGTHAGRMPLFLTRELEEKWLQPNLSDQQIQSVLDYALPAEELDYWPVHTIRGPKERPDQKKKYEPYNWPGLPALGNDNPVQQQQLF